MAKKKTDSKKTLDTIKARLEYELAISAFDLFVERFNNLSCDVQSKIIADVSIRSFRRVARRQRGYK